MQLFAAEIQRTASVFRALGRHMPLLARCHVLRHVASVCKGSVRLTPSAIVSKHCHLTGNDFKINNQPLQLRNPYDFVRTISASQFPDLVDVHLQMQSSSVGMGRWSWKWYGRIAYFFHLPSPRIVLQMAFVMQWLQTAKTSIWSYFELVWTISKRRNELV